LLESENLVCSVVAREKTLLSMLQRWFNYFIVSYLKQFFNSFPGRLRRTMSW